MKNDSNSGENTTKPVFKKPPETGEHRMNELYNRFRQIMIEFSELSLIDLEGDQNRALKDEILRDFMQLKRKYKLTSNGSGNNHNRVSDMHADS